LCDPFQQPGNCREKGSFTVEEKLGKCILQLHNFQQKDEGNYQAVFPSNLKHNRDIPVLIIEVKSQNTSLLIIVPCLIIVIVTFVIFVWWPRRGGGGVEKRREKDKNIMMTILDRNSKNFDDIVCHRNIIRVRDPEDNNIFHLTANENWTDENTQFLNNKLIKENKRKETSDEESQHSGNISNIYKYMIPNKRNVKHKVKQSKTK
jgi:hypothetical protein